MGINPITFYLLVGIPTAYLYTNHSFENISGKVDKSFMKNGKPTVYGYLFHVVLNVIWAMIVYFGMVSLCSSCT